MRRTTENAWYFFYAMLFVFLLAILAVEAWGQEAKPPTPEQQIEQLAYSILDFKNKLGAEMQISAQLKAQNMALRKKLTETQAALKEANAKVARMEMAPDIKRPEEKVEEKE